MPRPCDGCRVVRLDSSPWEGLDQHGWSGLCGLWLLNITFFLFLVVGIDVNGSDVSTFPRYRLRRKAFCTSEPMIMCCLDVKC